MKGLEKLKWVKELCDDGFLIDVEDKGCPNFTSLHATYCNSDTYYNCLSHNRSCALKNVICIKQWYFNKCTL